MIEGGKIVGIDKVMKNLNKALKEVKGGTMAGLIESFMLIRESMDKTTPTIPIDTGNLRASWFVVTSTGKTEKSGRFTGKDAGKVSTDTSNAIGGAKAQAMAHSNPVAIGGFGANYAIWVHEMNPGTTNFNAPRPGAVSKARQKGASSTAGPKFYQVALKRNQRAIIKILQRNARIK